MQFHKATKKSVRLRLGLIGPAGSGKTWTALATAKALGGRVALVDTERQSAEMYAGLYDFDVLQMHPPFSAAAYIGAVEAAAGYDTLIIDSLSHAWAGQGGILEFVDQSTARNKSGNKFAGWRDATPLHNKLVDTILGYGGHLIATMRVKTEWVLEPDDRGKMTPRRVGLSPVQRDGMEYEFHLVGDMDLDHRLIVTKSRIHTLSDLVIAHPSDELAKGYLAWASDAEPESEHLPASDAGAGLIDNIRKTLNWLRKNDVDGFGADRRVAASLLKHLMVESVLDITPALDADKLEAYYAHLQQIVNDYRAKLAQEAES